MRKGWTPAAFARALLGSAATDRVGWPPRGQRRAGDVQAVGGFDAEAGVAVRRDGVPLRVDLTVPLAYPVAGSLTCFRRSDRSSFRSITRKL
ncbi:hypothetical protein LQ51_25900 [Micromonospora sp. HK10]|nr:hypothetical protein LQ51_25900 [Micromonospora sp. HK10]